MYVRRKLVDAPNVQIATDSAKQHIESMRERLFAIDNDVHKQKRLAKQECVYCFYAIGRIGGASMTTAQCGLCDEEINFGNTCVDVLCMGCARRLGLCIHCGADIDLKHRRTKRDFTRTPNKPIFMAQ